MRLLTRRSAIFGFGALAVAGAIAAAAFYAFAPPEYDAQPVYTENGIAIRGTDPVAYFTEKRPVEGSPEFAAQWNGATWHFASGANRDRFLGAPDSYAPQYGGFCAWAVAAKGKLYSTQPRNWSIVGGKLYLNYSDAIQARWVKDIPGFVSKGDRRWPMILAAAG